MYGRDVVSVSVVERTKVRVKALEGGGFDVNSLAKWEVGQLKQTSVCDFPGSNTKRISEQ